jgi:hypothetical protein
MEGQKGLARAAEQPEAREVADLIAGAQARCSGACRKAMALATIGAGKADRARGIDRSPNRLIAAGIDRRFLDEQKRARQHRAGWILILELHRVLDGIAVHLQAPGGDGR